MGLDMYAESVPVEAIGDQQVDFTINRDTYVTKEIAYWRKFNALHGWMEDLYRAKGGGNNPFNCDYVRLTPDDLKQLKADMKKGLQPRQGFFWGAQEIYPEDIKTTKKFIKDATAEMKSGRAVVYTSWW